MNISRQYLLPKAIPPKAMYLGLGLLGAAAIAALYAFDPREPGNYPICPFLGLTGHYCPGCGSLRALRQMLHGDVAGALGYNAFAVLALPFVAYWFAAKSTGEFAGRSILPLEFIPHQWIWALLGAIIVFWTLRNLPIQPFSHLAP